MQKQKVAGQEFELFVQIQPKLYRYALGILGNPQDAEDALQEASLKVWNHNGRLANLTSVPAWLYRIV
ncbi:MAG: hypothetical protein NUK65_03505 [Firmicutes bacterium]|nr:hypothetical protein [Bacillota bacterium]